MRTTKTNGQWNLINEFGVLIYRGSFQGMMEALKKEW